MPANRNNTTTLVVIDNLFGDTGKWHAVQILLVTHLNTTQFKAHHSRIVTANVFHVAAVFVVSPCQTVHGIILMAEHDTFLAQGVKSVQELLSLCFLRLCLFRSAGNDSNHRYCKSQ